MHVELRLLSDDPVDGGPEPLLVMTASMKIIRPKVIKRYTALLNTQMYTKRNPAENMR